MSELLIMFQFSHTVYKNVGKGRCEGRTFYIIFQDFYLRVGEQPSLPLAGRGTKVGLAAHP